MGRERHLGRIQHQAARREGLRDFHLDRERGLALPCSLGEQHGGLAVAIDHALHPIRRGRASQARGMGGDGVGVLLRRGKGQHGNVLERLAGRRQLLRELQRALHTPFGADHVAHRLVGLDPRSARLAPTRAVEHANVHPQPAALTDGVLDHAPPFFGQGFHRAVFHIIQVDVADERLADPDAFHGFEVFGNALAGNVVSDPIPVAPWLGGIRRLREPALKQVGGGGGVSQNSQNSQCDQGMEGTDSHRYLSIVCSAIVEIVLTLRRFHWAKCDAQRLECIQLAGALVRHTSVRKREQAPRTPNASRISVAAFPGCAELSLMDAPDPCIPSAAGDTHHILQARRPAVSGDPRWG